ncbi:MAG: TspO/MBR family protein [Acidobacteriota bacterium]
MDPTTAPPAALEEPLGSEARADPAKKQLALFAVLSLVTLGLGGWLTSLGLGPWYDALKKPWFQPPGWVFSPAWTLILSLLAVATWRVAQSGARARMALWLYGVQLVLNAGWSLFFFALKSPAWALGNILILNAVVAAMIATYGRLHRAAGWMLVPYILWLGLATAINAWIVMNN